MFVCMYMYACMYVCMYVCINMYVCIYVYVCMYICLYVYMYVCNQALLDKWVGSEKGRRGILFSLLIYVPFQLKICICEISVHGYIPS